MCWGGAKKEEENPKLLFGFPARTPPRQGPTNKHEGPKDPMAPPLLHTPAPDSLEAAVARALALLDSLTDENRAAAHRGECLRTADLDQCKAIAFLESTRAGLGIVGGYGRGFLIAKV